MFFNKSKRSTLMFSKSTQKLSKCSLGALFLCFSIRALVLFSRSSHVFMCMHALYVCMHTPLLACLTIFCFFCFPNTLCFLDLKRNLNFSWQVQASSILCLYPFSVICITRQTSLHCFVFCKSWTWKVSMVFFRWVHPLFDVFTL